MRAVQIIGLDGPGAVTVNEIPEPPGDGTDNIVIDVHAAGVAFPDALLSRGLYQYKPEVPFTPGGEVAGVVRSAPDGAHVRAGDRVLGLTMITDGMAEVVVLHFALRTRGRLMPGETVLVHGAAGGIGTAALRLAPALGAGRTIAVVSTEDKIEVAEAAGADDVVLADGFRDAVGALTDGRGVDIVLDPVGGDRFTDSLRSLAPAGRLLIIGFTGGEIPTIKANRLLLNNVDAVGVGWGAWAMRYPGYLAEQWDELSALLAAGKVAAPQPQVYPLAEAGAAIASLENRTAKGKVVLAMPA